MKASKNSFPAATIMASAAFAILLLALLLLTGNAVAYGPNANLPTNESGQTIGTMEDVVETGAEPDLVAAVATNGRYGYVQSSELREAEHKYAASNPEEAVSIMDDREQKAIQILSKHLGTADDVQTLSGTEESTYAQIWNDIETVGLETALEASLSDPSSDTAAKSLAPNQTTIENIRNDLNDAFAEEINVYDADGTTIIGSFLVGSY